MSLPVANDDAATCAVLARGLVDPKFARSLLLGALPRSAAHRRAASQIDAERLALFAGFITKVRYNSDLFEHLPGTLRLLRYYGVELTAFRDYYLAGASRSKSTHEKVAAALLYFERFATSVAGRKVTGFADVVAHERVHWELSRALADWRSEPAANLAPPRKCPLRVIETRRDPHAVLDAVVRRQRPPRAARRPTLRLYWVDPVEREIRCVAIDARVNMVLEAIDGHRDLPAIAAAVRPARIAPRTAFDVVASLAAAGIVTIGGNRP
jgi:hypothetical protein